MRNWITATLIAMMIGLTGGATAYAADAPKKEAAIKPEEVKLGRPVDFEKDIMPILDNNCVACHNLAIAESKLILEDVPSILKGGKRGPSIVAKDPDKSLLYLVAARIKEPVMPPLPNKASAAALTSKELGLLRQWILEGATAGMSSQMDKVQWQPLPSGLTGIFSVALSSNGQLAAAGRTNQIVIYDTATGTERARLQDPALAGMQFNGKPMYPYGAAHRDFVHSLAFSPDGTLLASGDYRAVKLWKRPHNVQKFQQTLPNSVAAAAVSADGEWVALAVAGENTIRLWNVRDGKPGRVLTGHTGQVTGLRFFPDVSELAQADAAVAAAKTALNAAQDRLAAARKSATADPKNMALTAAVTAAEAAIAPAQAAVKAAADAREVIAKKIATGSKLFSGSADKTVIGWNLADGAVLGKITTPAAITDVAVNKDTTQVVSAGADNIIRVWKFPADPAGKPLAEMKGHAKPVTSIAMVFPAGTQVVSGSEDGTVRLWNLANGSQAFSQNHGAPVTAVAVKPDGQLIASASVNGSVKLWQPNGQPKGEIKGDPAYGTQIVNKKAEVDVAKQLVAIADASIKTQETDIKNREAAVKTAADAKTAADKALTEAQTKAKPILDAAAKAKTDLAAKKDDKALQKKSEDADKAAEAENVKVKAAMDAQASAVRAHQQAEMAVVTAKKKLDSEKAEKTAAEANQKKLETELKTLTDGEKATEKPIRALSFSPNGKLLATAGDDFVARIYEPVSGTLVDSVTSHKGSVGKVLFADNDNLVTAAADKIAAAWNLNSPWTLAGVLGPTPDQPMNLGTSKFINRVLALAFSRDGKLLATGGGDPSRSGELQIWDVEKKTLVREIKEGHSDTVFGVEFSFDGKYLLTGAADKFVKIFEVATGKFVRSFEGHTHHVMGVSWKADGRTIASAGADNAIKVWNVETGEQARTISNYSKQVTSIQFIGTGDNMVSSSGDANIRMHRAANGQNYRNFSGASDYVYSVAATPDEKIVAAGGEDGVLRIWNGTNSQLLYSFNPPKMDEQSNTQASTKK